MFLNIRIFPLHKLLIFLTLTGLSYAQENYELTDISIKGNQNIETDIILDKLTQTTTSWFSKNILREKPFLFSSDILSSDLSNIVGLYQREGFLFVKVSSAEIVDHDNQSIELELTIDEGPPIIIDSVSIYLNEISDSSLTDPDSLLSSAYDKLALTKGKRFRDDEIKNDQTRIIALFLDNGYPRVTVNYKLEVDTTSCTVIVQWFVNSGPLSEFGETEITGMNIYSENLIRSKLKYAPGEVYNSEALNRTQQRLQDLGLFYGINFYSMVNSDYEDIVPIELKVVEAKRLKTTLGLGYGSDEKFRIALELTYLGVLRGPGKLNFEAKRSAIEEFSFKLGYDHPEFIWERSNFRLNTFAIKVDELPYEENAIGINVGIFRSFSKHFFASVNYIHESIDLDVTSIAIQDDTSQIKEEYSKSGINVIMKNTNSEPYGSPVEGFTISLSATYSGLGIETPYDFFKSIVKLTNYQNIFYSLVAGLKLSLGYLESFNDPEFVPVEERFYLGGSSSVRGWERLKLSPMDINDVPKGGSSFFEAGIELRYPVHEKLYGVLFLDFGNVWEQTLTYKLNELQYAAGFGLRYATPIGPIRFDYAVPVFNEYNENQFWLSIGHAF